MPKRKSSVKELMLHFGGCYGDKDAAAGDIFQRIKYARAKFNVSIDHSRFNVEKFLVFYWSAVPKNKDAIPACAVCIPIQQTASALSFMIVDERPNSSGIIPAVTLEFAMPSPIGDVLFKTLSSQKNQEGLVPKFFESIVRKGLDTEFSGFSLFFGALPKFSLLDSLNLPAIWLPCYNQSLDFLHKLAVRRMGNLGGMTKERAKLEFQRKKPKPVYFRAGPAPKEIDILIAYHWVTWEALDLTWTERLWWLEKAASSMGSNLPTWRNPEKSLIQHCLNNGFLCSIDRPRRKHGSILGRDDSVSEVEMPVDERLPPRDSAIETFLTDLSLLLIPRSASMRK